MMMRILQLQSVTFMLRQLAFFKRVAEDPSIKTYHRCVGLDTKQFQVPLLPLLPVSGMSQA